MQHSGIGGFGKLDGLLILYHGLIKISVYCSALVLVLTNYYKVTHKVNYIIARHQERGNYAI